MNAIATALQEAVDRGETLQTTTPIEAKTPDTESATPTRRDTLETALKTARDNLIACDRAEKLRKTDLDKIQMQLKIKPTPETTAQETVCIEALAEAKLDTEDAKRAVKHAEHDLLKLTQDEHRQRLQDEADDVPDVQFPELYDGLNKVMMICAMAENLQFRLISGEFFYDRQYAKVHLRPFGEDTGGAETGLVNTGPEEYDQEMELHRLETERDNQRIMMMALKRQYVALSLEHQATERYWPNFTRRNDTEVRRQVEQSQARRTQEYIEHQQRLREGAAEVSRAEHFTI